LDEPGASVRYGSVIAAPVVGNIFRDSLRYLGVKPQYSPETLEKMAAESVTVPDVLNRKAAEALKLLKQNQIPYRTIGEGDLVYDQVPKAGTTIARGVKVILYLDPEAKYQSNVTKVAVPELRGLNLLKVEQILAELGLKSQTAGAGRVVSQSPAAGTIVDYGSVIQVELKE
jgi:stage V sporulation protein D (sporulation-specific penicillin-binding protein)